MGLLESWRVKRGDQRHVGHGCAARPRLESLEDRFLLAYTITGLGSLGGIYTYAYGLNNLGQVVGQSDTAVFGGHAHAFVYRDHVMTDLGVVLGFSDLNSKGEAINDRREITVTVINPGNTAYLYAHGRVKRLDTLGGMYNEATAINDAGQVAGLSQLANGTQHAFLYQDGTYTDLDPNGTFTNATAINSAGQVVGLGLTAGATYYHALQFDHGAVIDLGTLGGDYSVATSINAAGEVAGYSTYAGGQFYDFHAFVYHQHRMTDLGTLGGAWSYAYGINSQGWVVGKSVYATGPYHAFLYRNGQMTDLNALIPPHSGWTLTEATAINDNGQIVGDGTDPSGQEAAFLLTPLGAPDSDAVSLVPAQVEAVLVPPVETLAGWPGDATNLPDDAVAQPPVPQSLLDFTIQESVHSKPSSLLPVPPRQGADLGIVSDLMSDRFKDLFGG